MSLSYKVEQRTSLLLVPNVADVAGNLRPLPGHLLQLLHCLLDVLFVSKKWTKVKGLFPK